MKMIFSLGLLFLCSFGWSQTTKTVGDLLEMDKSARKAYIKSIPPSQRQGLWFQVKSEIAKRRGTVIKKSSDYSSSFELSLQPADYNIPFFSSSRAIGTISYNSGFPSIGFGGGQIVGNRFNTHTGLPVNNGLNMGVGTISTIQAAVVPGPAFTNASSNVQVYIFGPQSTMGGLPFLFSSVSTANGVIDSISMTGLGVGFTGSEFFVLLGDFAQSYIPVLGSGTTLGQGYHGLVGYTGGAPNNVMSTGTLGGNRNTFIRATGNIVPVELMNLEVE